MMAHFKEGGLTKSSARVGLYTKILFKVNQKTGPSQHNTNFVNQTPDPKWKKVKSYTNTIMRK